MKAGFICVAGVEPDTLKLIRPVLKGGQLPRNLLRKEGGALEIGALVDLGETKKVARAPEMEDHEFSLNELKLVRRLKPTDFWKLLGETSHSELRLIFGDDLRQHGKSCTVDVGCGVGSLGHLVPGTIEILEVNTFGKIRIQISDGHLGPNISVTDIRLYKSDHDTARKRITENVAKRLSKTKVLLAVGLTRAWRKPGDTAPRHWLQVNNIHLEEDPLGQIFEF